MVRKYSIRNNIMTKTQTFALKNKLVSWECSRWRILESHNHEVVALSSPCWDLAALSWPQPVTPLSFSCAGFKVGCGVLDKTSNTLRSKEVIFIHPWMRFDWGFALYCNFGPCLTCDPFLCQTIFQSISFDVVLVHLCSSKMSPFTVLTECYIAGFLISYRAC